MRSIFIALTVWTLLNMQILAAPVGTQKVGGYTLTLSVERPGASGTEGMNEDGMGPGGGMGGGGMMAMMDIEKPTHRLRLNLTGPRASDVRMVRAIAVRKQTDAVAMTVLRPSGHQGFSGMIALPGKGAYRIQLRFAPMEPGRGPGNPIETSFDFKY